MQCRTAQITRRRTSLAASPDPAKTARPVWPAAARSHRGHLTPKVLLRPPPALQVDRLLPFGERLRELLQRSVLKDGAVEPPAVVRHLRDEHDRVRAHRGGQQRVRQPYERGDPVGLGPAVQQLALPLLQVGAVRRVDARQLLAQQPLRVLQRERP
mgnify:CR=1 FL=1|eukprot:CAMPEP_0181209382 /NCGR_PEP_ID=MMETSP1096-20121128/22639_1 /TAXON_ID=156174 ORGANISM="Chrysochromulina ericina, Strain CCMP281" /NCGR_SAMPLE_ID=MMETSP1096 /ASSEMBLY_ACC=CAM_ASM_000453 /LENGTH=155 /DNA_ID=CAMNT_0023300545 /DNA_START=1 /DNA_END=468 /DNA_ORIENTATION=-